NGDDVTLGDFPHSGPLAKDGAYSESHTIVLPANLVGNFFVFVRTDATTRVTEQDESNNSSAPASLAVTKPFADLVVEAVSAPDSALAGDRIALSWRVRNVGIAVTDASTWTDRVVLSSDETLDATDLELGQVAHAGSLAVNANYVSTANLLLPHGLAGD